MKWGYMQGKVDSRIDSMRNGLEIPYLAHASGKLDMSYLEYLAAYDVIVSENVPQDIMEYRTPAERDAIMRDILSGANREMSKITGQDEGVVELMVLEISRLIQAYKESMPKSD